ncbi:MAG: SDR family NAD(P)-dependent oxidoreductase [Cyanobacteria bacterium P01_F01_bin.150]
MIDPNVIEINQNADQNANQDDYGDYRDTDIAIVAMSGRFPGANTLDAFWQNLQGGVESVSHFSASELQTAGVPANQINHPSYIPAKGILSAIDYFDAHFFGFSAREAELIDPQHRLFLECVWECLERGGYDPSTYKRAIGVYGGASSNSYFLHNLAQNPTLDGTASPLQRFLAADKDFISTRIAYKLGLTGPAITVQTACSTSLVAVHLACQGLLNGECDLALAGGASIHSPQISGYVYEPGMIFSPDGHCRAFDAQARGTISGNGVGVVLLKRLQEAMDDHDPIQAVIKGSAVNNDGSLKVGFTAPSVEGQASVIAEAQAVAEVSADTITYVEAHGTGTELGDPIEIEALTRAFRQTTTAKEYCAIGSLKTNMGHLDAAAGVAGLIKTVLALQHQQIPASLHFQTPNPKIDFGSSPFFVNTTLRDWPILDTPRRAGVSSFGIGGTNAHVVLEEAPRRSRCSTEAVRPQLLVLSAKTESALAQMSTNLATHLQHHPEVSLADVAYTLSLGRRAFPYRQVVVATSGEEAIGALRGMSGFQHRNPTEEPAVFFLFPGQGSQYVNMGRDLYEQEPTFRECIDQCAAILESHLKLDLRTLLYPTSEQTESATQQLNQTAIAQPALFTIEYALAKLWQSWGIVPQGTIGHSIGEYVAACLAGVFDLDTALMLLATRGQLIQQLPAGDMVSVPLSAEQLQPLLKRDCAIAAINEPSRCVVSGTREAIAQLETTLTTQGVESRRLHTSHAFHSPMMTPILDAYTRVVAKVSLNPPQMPFISGVTGTWITSEQATDPHYWSQHLRATVQFDKGMAQVLESPAQILLEVGPGRTLSTFAKRHPQRQTTQAVLTSMRHPQETGSDLTFILQTLGHLWLNDPSVNWSAVYAHQDCYRIPLPTYPFQRQKYWISPPSLSTQSVNGDSISPSTDASLVPTLADDLWTALVTAGHRQVEKTSVPLTIAPQRDKRERLSLAYMLLALKKLGLFRQADKWYQLATVDQHLHVQPHYLQLLTHWMITLADRNLLHRDKDKILGVEVPDATTLIQEVENNPLKEASGNTLDGSESSPTLAHQCGPFLSPVLRGEMEPLEMFANLYGSTSQQQIWDTDYFNQILSTCVSAIANRLANQHLRILEVGAGTGLTTTALLPVLTPSKTHYTFTDLGSYFLLQAQQKFQDFNFVEYRQLDISQSPQQQDYEPNSFDVIVAANVLHVTPNLGNTLSHIRSLLANGGCLLIWEITEESLEFQVSWGLLMNALADGKRTQAHPFISIAQWKELLLCHGFSQVTSFPDASINGMAVLVAQADNSVSQQIPSAFTIPIPSVQPSIRLPAMKDWFYVPSWTRLPLAIPNPALESNECWLFFLDQGDLGLSLAQDLSQLGAQVYVVEKGDGFAQLTGPAARPSGTFENQIPTYSINPANAEDYQTLLCTLKETGYWPTQIVHLWTVTPPSTPLASVSLKDRLNTLETWQDLAFYSLVFLGQALGKHKPVSVPCQLTAISNEMQVVIGNEPSTPEKSLLLGPVQIIAKEYPNITCRSVDLDFESFDRQDVLTELRSPITHPIIAYRSGHRWVRTVEPMPIAMSTPIQSRFRPQGVYLITGGLGGIGLSIATYLAQTVQAKLALLGRSPFPPRTMWDQWLADHPADDPTHQKIQTLRTIESLGSEVLILQADVTDYTQMEQAVLQAQTQLGDLNGVIHGAGVPSGGLIQSKTRAIATEHMACKLQGTLILDTLVQDCDLDFFIVFSTLNAIIPVLGQVDHCGGNAFLDAFAWAQNHHKAGPLTISINWDGWQQVGQAAAAARDSRYAEHYQTVIDQFLTPEEGAEAFGRIAHQSFPQILVSTVDLQTRLQNALDFNNPNPDSDFEQTAILPSMPKAPSATTPSPSTPSVTAPPVTTTNTALGTNTHPRPQLSVAYVAPRTPEEQTMVEIWQDILGIEPIGINDNFLELGGDSLIATQIVMRLRKAMANQLAVARLFESPTISDLATYLSEHSEQNPTSLDRQSTEREEIDL